MNFAFPLLAAVLQAASFTIDKAVLSIKKVSFQTYAGVSFPMLFLITLVIFGVVRPPLSVALLQKTFWLIASLAGLTVVSNVLFYRALDHDKLGEIQTFDLLHSIPIILFSGLIFADERNFFVLVPALVASVAVVWSHWEHHHFQIAKKTAPYLMWSLASAPVGAALSKILLAKWSPISLELVRGGLVTAVMALLFSKYIDKAPARSFGFFLMTNFFSTVAWLLFYKSYQVSGVVYTILLFSLQPLLVYFAAVFFLKERFHLKKFIAFVVVLGSIAIAQISS